MEASAFFYVAVEAGRCADIVLLPGAHLQDQVVGVGAGDEVGAVVFDDLLRRWCRAAPRCATAPAPPLLRVEPAGPDQVEGLDALFGLGGVVAVWKAGSVVMAAIWLSRRTMPWP